MSKFTVRLIVYRIDEIKEAEKRTNNTTANQGVETT